MVSQYRESLVRELVEDAEANIGSNVPTGVTESKS
jgi:hypothetical protein